MRTGAVRRPPARLGASPALVILRWHHELGVLPVTRSSDERRQQDNLALTGIDLTHEEMADITAPGRRGSRLWDGDPDRVWQM